MELLHAVFNHLVMPPHLPGRQDTDIEAISRNVLMRIIRACEAVDALASPPWSEAFQSLLASLNACFALNQGRLDRSTMLEHFHDLQPNHMLILHVVQQNAALLVQRESWLVHNASVVTRAPLTHSRQRWPASCCLRSL